MFVKAELRETDAARVLVKGAESLSSAGESSQAEPTAKYSEAKGDGKL